MPWAPAQFTAGGCTDGRHCWSLSPEPPHAPLLRSLCSHLPLPQMIMHVQGAGRPVHRQVTNEDTETRDP
jgi:hypothetical protein